MNTATTQCSTDQATAILKAMVAKSHSETVARFEPLLKTIDQLRYPMKGNEESLVGVDETVDDAGVARKMHDWINGCGDEADRPTKRRRIA